jgi:hypothetical protein
MMLDQAAPPLECNDPNWGLSRVKSWDLKLSWLPRTCFLSSRQLWGQQAYHGVRWIHGPGEPVEEEYWIERNEFLLWRLKK